jgi:hypothetical protein
MPNHDGKFRICFLFFIYCGAVWEIKAPPRYPEGPNFNGKLKRNSPEDPENFAWTQSMDDPPKNTNNKIQS